MMDSPRLVEYSAYSPARDTLKADRSPAGSLPVNFGTTRTASLSGIVASASIAEARGFRPRTSTRESFIGAFGMAAVFLAFEMKPGPVSAEVDFPLMTNAKFRLAGFTDETRVEHGLSTLPYDFGDSQRFANASAATQSDPKKELEHGVDEAGVSRIDRAFATSEELRGRRVAENLARINVTLARSQGFQTPEQLAELINQGWENSKGHLNNMLDPKHRYQTMGAAMFTTASGVDYMVFSNLLWS